jgi:3-deoxy-manno-octulosonate cytidylyltransferase (CMP-KDO synthetase)
MPMETGALIAVGVIPARWGSSRLPGKSLIPLCGKPLIQWVVEGAGRAKSLRRLMVATDDGRIMDAVRQLGVEAVMTRPDHPSGTDRVAEAVQHVEADVVVNIQGDEPLIDPGLIDRLVAVMRADPKRDMATAAAPISRPADLDNPSVVKVVWNREGEALYFSRSAIPHVRDRGEESPGPGPVHWRHIGLYAYRKPFLERLVKEPPSRLERIEKLEQLRALHIGGRIAVVETREPGIGVDTPEDIPRVEAMLRTRAAAG